MSGHLPGRVGEGPEPVGGRARLGYVVRGEQGNYAPSTHIRVLRRVTSPHVESRMSAQQKSPEQLIRSECDDLDVLLVQRDALTVDADLLLPVLRRAGVRLVVELDDDLVSDRAGVMLSPDPAIHTLMRGRLTTLLRRADSVVVSTSELAERAAGWTSGDIAVVPNELDPRLWLTEVKAPDPDGLEELVVLYMGSLTHLDDLALVEHLAEEATAVLGREVVLEIVGVAGRLPRMGRIRRFRAPQTLKQYPDFVRWLRMNRRRWSAGVAPLVDTPFNAAKSDLKLLEYAGLGLPAVASAVGPYSGSTLAQVVENNPAAWTDGLVRVLSDAAGAADAVSRARRVVLTERMIDPARDHWFDVVTGTVPLPGRRGVTASS